MQEKEDPRRSSWIFLEYIILPDWSHCLFEEHVHYFRGHMNDIRQTMIRGIHHQILLKKNYFLYIILRFIRKILIGTRHLILMKMNHHGNLIHFSQTMIHGNHLLIHPKTNHQKTILIGTLHPILMKTNHHGSLIHFSQTMIHGNHLLIHPKTNHQKTILRDTLHPILMKMNHHDNRHLIHQIVHDNHLLLHYHC